MSDPMPPYFIAIDGGGTSSRFALHTPGKRLFLNKGSANVFTAPEAAIETMRAGLTDLCAQAQIDLKQLATIPIYAGLAGVVDRTSAISVAEKLPSRHVLVEDDRRSSVVGALGKRSGCLIGIGTGSFLARQAGGDVAFIGGYGPDLGDEASASWLGRCLLRRALHVLDKLAPSSGLVDACLGQFQHDTAQIVNFSGKARPVDFGAFAPKIVRAAKAGDVVGRELMTAGADYISKGLTALGRIPGEPICPVGGVAAHYTGYLPVVVAADITEGQGVPLDGALELARRFAIQIAREMA